MSNEKSEAEIQEIAQELMKASSMQEALIILHYETEENARRVLQVCELLSKVKRSQE